MASDPKEIWLEPACCADPHTGRLWAEDNPFPECDDGVKPTRYIRGDLAALSASPAPAGDLVERETHRWNIERDGDDLLVCSGDHEKHEPCEWIRYSPARAAIAAMQPGSGND
jgi:hypothetical protein